MEKRYRVFLSYWFIGVSYLFSVIRATLVPMHIPVQAGQMLLFSLGVFLFYALMKTRVGRAVFLSSIAVFISYLIFLVIKNGTEILPAFFSPVTRLVQVIVQVGTGYYDDSVPYSMLMVAIGLFSMMTALPIYFFLIKEFRFYPLILPGLAFFMTVWGFNHQVDKFSFFLFIVLAIICFIQHRFLQHIKINSEEHIFSDTVSMPLYFIPIALIVIVFATSIQVNPKPIQWPWLDENINTVYWNMYNKFSVDRYDKFSLANTGFGNPSRLGGPIRPDYTPVMTVKAPARVYLRGAVYDRYTGIGWEETERDKEMYLVDRSWDYQELQYGWKASIDPIIMKYGNKELELFDDLRDPEEYIQFLKLQNMPEELRRLHPNGELVIRHLNIRTKTVFTPLKTITPIKGLTSDGYRLIEDISGIVHADKRLKGQTSYDVSYIQPGYGMAQLEDFFHTSQTGMIGAFIDYNIRFMENLSEDDVSNPELAEQEVMEVIHLYRKLQMHRDQVYELYTTLPEQIPERVITLAEEISSDMCTNYGKVKNIEKYLQENYRYTMNPPYTPQEKDFVDYFLFEGKEGYCSYFASAMCVMTRALGLPSRYVEGFLLPEEPDDNGYYHVTNQNAHAWVEVYLEGIGWVTFEPTTPFAGAMNYSINLNANQDEQGNSYDIYSEFDDESYMEQYGSDYHTDMAAIEDHDVSTSEILLYTVLAILFLVLINWIFILGRWFIFYLLSPRKSVPFLYYYTVRLLKHTNCNVQEGETPRDFAKRVDERYHLDNMSMNEMVNIFYSVRFGARVPDRKRRKKLFWFTWEVKKKTGRNMYIGRRILKRGFLFQG